MRTSDSHATAAKVSGSERSSTRDSVELFPEISDYAVIGDCRSCALIDRTGAIEWMCLPDFSSPSLFAALLDRSAGHFRIAADVPYRIERTYAGASAVLQTRFHTADGVLQLTDCAVLPPARDCGGLHPQQELLREVECLEGCVPVRVEFAPRPDYGSALPRLHDRGRLGWHFRHGRTSLYLRSEVELRHDQAKAALIGREVLRAGECRRVSLMLDDAYPCVFLPLGDAARQRMRRTIDWWQQWCSRCTYEGRYRQAVERSLLTLKVMTSCLSGAMLAAATTSLPEWIGGDRNWDYRYCWVRDSALALHAFLRLGYLDEAGHFLHWLLHGTRLRSPMLQVMYDLYGETRLHERELHHLSGYRGSRPVRSGNAAHRQLQLDIYGELIASVSEFVDAGGRLDGDERRVLRGIGDVVMKSWRKPDNGIWESRAEPRHYTYSKAMCWLALQQLARLLPEAPERDHWERESELIRKDVETFGFDSSCGGYIAAYGVPAADASLLLLSRIGFHRADHPRLRGTFDFIDRKLREDEALLGRCSEAPEAGNQVPDNLFAACGFWAVEHLALAGDRVAARRRFESLLSRANDVGLYAEEFERGSHRHVGNFPQALTHISLISAALALDQHPGSHRGTR